MNSKYTKSVGFFLEINRHTAVNFSRWDYRFKAEKQLRFIIILYILSDFYSRLDLLLGIKNVISCCRSIFNLLVSIATLQFS